jgi:hypothetical protein
MSCAYSFLPVDQLGFWWALTESKMLPLPVGRLEETERSKLDYFPATPSSDEESRASSVVYPGVHYYNPAAGPVFVGYVPYVQMVPCVAPEPAAGALEPEFNVSANRCGNYVLRMDVRTLLHSRRVRDFISDQSMFLPDGHFGFKVMIQPVQPSHGKARFKTCSRWNLILKTTETLEKLEGPPQRLAVYINGARVGTWSPGEFTFDREVLAEDVQQNEKLTLRLAGI